MKTYGNSIYKPLQLFSDLVLEKGELLEFKCEKANVTPIHKKRNKQTLGNYRPVSLLRGQFLSRLCPANLDVLSSSSLVESRYVSDIPVTSNLWSET